METPIERGETPIKCGETPINCGETPIERGETLVSRGETWGNVGKRGAYRGVAEGGPRRCRRLNEIYLLNNKIHKNKYESIIGKCR